MIKTVKIGEKHTLKSWRFWIGCVVLALLSFVLVFSVFLVNAIRGISLTDYKTDIVNISSGDDFVSEMLKNSKLGNIAGKKTYYLTDNIVLSTDNINDLKKAGELNFYGILDGYDANRADSAGKNQCYKISFSNEASSMNKPLFNVISKGAIVRNLTIEPVEYIGEIGRTIAVLSNINQGTLENINLINTTIDISNNPIAASAITVYNYGTISHCVADVKFKVAQEYISSDVGKSGDWRCVVGAIAANNGDGGEINNVIASVDYPYDFLVLSRQYYRNLNVGYIVGAWSDSSKLNNLSVLYDFTNISAELFIMTAHDFADLSRDKLTPFANGGSEGGKMNETTFHGWELWNFFDGNSLPVLVDGTNKGENNL